MMVNQASIKNKIVNKGDAVEVLWADSTTHTGWKTSDKIDRCSLSLIRSVGVFAGLKDEFEEQDLCKIKSIAIAGSIHIDDDDHTDVNLIPLDCVMDINVLEVKK